MPSYRVVQPLDPDLLIEARQFRELAAHDPWVAAMPTVTVNREARQVIFELTTITGEYRPQNDDLYRYVRAHEWPRPPPETYSGDGLALLRGMVNPLRSRIDYVSVARRSFLVEELPQGALPIYNRDPDVAQVVSAPSRTEWPDWVVPGVWIQNTATKLLGQIIVVDDAIHLDAWKDGVRHVVSWRNVDQWRQAEEPYVRPWYERMDDIG